MVFKPQCKDALQQSSPYKTFKLDEDKDKVLAKYCIREAELPHLTKQASRTMKTIYKTLKVIAIASGASTVCYQLAVTGTNGPEHRTCYCNPGSVLMSSTSHNIDTAESKQLH